MTCLSLREKRERKERVLAHLYLNPGWHLPGEICEALALGRSAGTVGILLKEMVEEELLEFEKRNVQVNTKKRWGMHSRRQSIYKITQKGIRHIKEILKRANAAAEGETYGKLDRRST